MAYLGLCDPCKTGDHDNHEESHHTPPQMTGEFICGGGICQCPGNCSMRALICKLSKNKYRVVQTDKGWEVYTNLEDASFT